MDTRKVAVITGASQGIGAGLVEGYRGLGYAVVANSRSIAPRADDSLVTVAGDISDPDVAERVIATAVDRFGRVDALVNNAGVFIAKPFTEYTTEDLDAALGLNLRGFFHVTQKAVADTLTRNAGHVVNITTTLVENADSNVPSALASLTKGGLASVVKSLAIELAPAGSVSTPCRPASSRRRCTHPRPTPPTPGCTRSGGWGPSTTSCAACSTSSRRLS
ncbi:NAD(P)-dependent dehydrogenase (short-subunit alcohol dehydrogenase family) [Leifsonia sp. 1010]|nr:SDR family NAD(P)-dependent oxidoreductase [Leifsonia sp. 1010]MDR6612068.1 NAD(P)-dependent dehydrogenase (short-subunit alcohol dehydrogenase family) [Leifsonia sp. 1010]